jgi:hypothetical protein
MSKNIYKAKVASSVSATWTVVSGTNTRGAVEVLSVQWSENDGSSVLQIEEAKGGDGDTYDTDRDDDIAGSTLNLTSSTSQDVTVFAEPIPMFLPLYYNDAGGGSNVIIVKYRNAD